MSLKWHIWREYRWGKGWQDISIVLCLGFPRMEGREGSISDRSYSIMVDQIYSGLLLNHIGVF